MIGPVSTTGQAMMQSLQNAMAKGMPAEQAIAYVKSLAMDGIAPLTDLYAMMMQFQRLKQPTRRPPEGGSIRENLQALEAPRDPMSMGLGGMNAGSMENPSFAGGGIVAFQQGGGAQTQSASMVPEFYGQVPQFKTYDEMADFYNKQLQDPKMIEQELARREAMQRQLGLGEFGKSFEMREDLLEEDKKRAETVAAEEAGYDEDEYWGDVAANAAQSGATLLTSLAKAQKGKASRKRATAEKARQAIREAKQTEILLEQAREAEKAGRLKEAEALRAKAAEMATAAREKSVEAKQKEVEDLRSRETQERVAKIYKRETGVAAERAEMLQELRAMEARGQTDTPEYARKWKLFNESGGAAGRSGNISVMRTLLTGAQRKEQAARKILTDPMQRRLATPEAIAQAEADIAEAQTQINELLTNYPELQAAIAPQSGAQGGTQGVLKYNPATGKIE